MCVCLISFCFYLSSLTNRKTQQPFSTLLIQPLVRVHYVVVVSPKFKVFSFSFESRRVQKAQSSGDDQPHASSRQSSQLRPQPNQPQADPQTLPTPETTPEAAQASPSSSYNTMSDRRNSNMVNANGGTGVSSSSKLVSFGRSNTLDRSKMRSLEMNIASQAQSYQPPQPSVHQTNAPNANATTITQRNSVQTAMSWTRPASHISFAPPPAPTSSTSIEQQQQQKITSLASQLNSNVSSAF